MLLENTIGAIGELFPEPMAAAQSRLDSLIKPPGSLGRLEELAVRLAGMTGNPRPVINDRVIIIMAGDHGVVAEGVSAAPQEITHQQIPAFLQGVAGIGVLGKLAGTRLVVVDVGVAVPVDYPGVLQRKVRAGTGNIARGPAMTREEALQAVEVGIQVVRGEIDRGATLVGLGDMGIGNTTPSSAIAAALGGFAPEEVTGRGTLVNDEVLRRKVAVVTRALEVNRPDPADGLDVLAKVGGLEIAGLTGVILGAAARRVPVVIDGFITTAAAMVAAALQPRSRNFMIASHLSGEQGHRLMLEHLGLVPMLHLNMRLGEGTGAALAMPLVEAACRVINEMASFSEAGIADLETDKLLR
ncbi:nicotinate-nucleotide--dimethylbenzimidazole phosphoribosyltransferase [Desulfofundulus thermobenzoicus]|uniref:Nicotinate-nucleotide--dimethylbenzimidazole phosphoribosyltransferase n=1 Tax=Desulfofundulus thermobenzoicus TaxID=29376 RepID=A0A6N7IMT8_9FIRM|nr:nicotinate-nucleotide--dimethylbenzimidazole phosphoribosyltransferase [Desulfofundulus thermobenzoicus]MQL51244.1 nicotinate-nucleotide--dimethylbenzimidazole phosphoribosyltransferase [Desulfofundulus thermobenzoicus]